MGVQGGISLMLPPPRGREGVTFAISKPVKNSEGISKEPTNFFYTIKFRAITSLNDFLRR